jgi:hypothetical protein
LNYDNIPLTRVSSAAAPRSCCLRYPIVIYSSSMQASFTSTIDREMASVARQPAAATSMMARVGRLDLVLGYLEELHHHRGLGRGSNAMTSSSSLSTATTNPSAESSPRGSWRRTCRPAKEVLDEAHAKGSLVDRIAFLEDRVLKMEDDMEITPERGEGAC